jgi:hypothetical protein
MTPPVGKLCVTPAFVISCVLTGKNEYSTPRWIKWYLAPMSILRSSEPSALQ